MGFRETLRVEGSDPDPALGGPSPLTINWGRRRAFLPPLLVRWAGPARGKGRGWGPPCAAEAERAQLGHIWPERGGTKWSRRPPFIPRGEGRP